MIGQRITAALSLKGVMQKQLAEHMRVKDNVVSYWCSGSRTPSAMQIVEIAKHLGVSTDYLLGVSSVPTTDKDLQFVCDYTGLSEENIEFFKSTQYPISKEFVRFVMHTNYFDRADDTTVYVLHDQKISACYFTDRTPITTERKGDRP